MQRELAQLLRDQRHQAGAVRTRRHFAEPHLVTLHEQLDAEQAPTAEVVGDRTRDFFRACQRRARHRLRLPALAVIAVLLQVADRRAERSATGVAHGQQGDLVIEVDEAFDDAAAGTGTATGLRIVPGRGDVRLAAQRALALARGRHHRLDHARQADRGHRGTLLGLGIDEAVRRGRQPEGLGGQAADAFTVHGQACGARGRDHPQALLLFQLDQGLGVDGFDLRHHQVRLLLRDQRAQGHRVQHVDHRSAAITSTPSRCSSMATSLPSSPEPSSSTRVAEGDNGVPSLAMAVPAAM
ncbi:hypothetical protein G6F40_012587 [Rhizopus arrhizus]|nr:hypothetical protein G6F40_012587 [Rhizopus arrhizus]